MYDICPVWKNKIWFDLNSKKKKRKQLQVSGMDGSQFQLMEEPFLHMICEVLQDRYNDKAENLFRKFYQFCLKYILEGFNS